jgi:superfamily I DNA and/or RNA helicase/predicted DNA-binding WGR domain protein
MKFKQFLETAFDKGDFATDDVIAFVLPLFEEVLSFHEANNVAAFERDDVLFVADNHLDIDESHTHKPRYAINKVQRLFLSHKSSHIEVVSNLRVDTDVDEGNVEVSNLNVHLNINEPLAQAAYIPGYSCFEILLGHHDPLTDIFCLGTILGSMALSLDLHDHDDLKLFVEYRTNPVLYNQRIHPTISGLITEMTALDRDKRSQDLYEIIERLKHYREYNPEKQTDLSHIAGWVNKELKERSQFILNKLRNRLFDTSRRNRLLYYKPNMRFVNLTVSSVPMVLHHQSIRPDLLFTWNNEVSSKVTGMKEIVLNKYLRFEDHQYLPSSLDKIRTIAKFDIQEYGFSQLKLVITFLNWHNLKEDVAERIQSPLLLIPVELGKNKKLKEDHYVMKILDNAAEVNPVLANQLRELYGSKLPDFVDLDEMSLEQFYQLLKSQIDAANQGIQLKYIDKPRIKLVHSIAKQTVTNYRKRLRRTSNGLGSYKHIAYSYEAEHYKPLGLEIFRQRIEPRATHLEFLINEDVKIASHQFAADAKERELYELTDSERNPYSWDYDVCNMVLGNFNYKKMSLVRDYTNVIDNKVEHAVFEELFSNQPKQLKEVSIDLNKVEDWHHVITADPTQTQAILKSRTGESYIIQGPPGTGKSQTITNLIADYVARGKNILFVCEKRAALDVVFHRLKQNGLDELCCYIHDSQGDKREFIKNLKVTYEDFIGKRMDLVAIKIRRSNLLQKLNEQLEVLKTFHFTNTAVPNEAGMEIRKLVERAIEVKNHITSVSAKDEELLPHYKDWLQFGDTIKHLSAALEEAGGDASFAGHPLSNVNEQVFLADNPQHMLDSMLQQSKNLLDEISAVIKESNIEAAHSESLEQIKNLVQDAVLMHDLAETGNLQLVNSSNKEAKQFEKELKAFKKQQQQYEDAQEANKHWLNKFSEQDLDNALPIAAKNEKAFFGFLNGSWRRLKKQLRTSYDFSKHQVKPSYTNILAQLKEEYNAASAIASIKKELQEKYGLDNINATYLNIQVLRGKQGDKEIDYLLQHPQANNLVIRLNKLHSTLHQLEVQLGKCLNEYASKSLNELYDELESISVNSEGLRDLLPALRSFAKMPKEIKQALRQVPSTPGQAEAMMARKTLNHIYQQHKAFAGIDLPAIEKAVDEISYCYNELLKVNAEQIRATIRHKFHEHLEISNMALSQLNNEQRQFKKAYCEGRKILENEFGKSMRYKSIRELSSKESGLVLKDLKPVWLMSPLSVSDSLPLHVGYFDVVIFDEASQITLEEGVPALYRAPQTVIVGDDKQMPPTNFFSARAEDPDDLSDYEEEDDELLSSDADSLLVQGSRKLNSTMLCWHYRSRYETLISYSNHAFYGAGLLTIPDKAIHHNEKTVLEVKSNDAAKTNADALYDRSISYHYLPDAVYEKRSNVDEAHYIATLVRELLVRRVKESIGLVAFSQEQQQHIEDELTLLAEEDKEFEQLLEEAYNRTENDQFVGLIIKNLENIQGDERDIIIMSVCYGFDAKKKMIMNFGPINKKGGEKRLNVIFSRAKKHMAIVSSIKHHHITNEYNEGANYFRRFLHYAELVSGGNIQTARTVLDGLMLQKHNGISDRRDSVMLREIKHQLQQHGYEVDEHIGQSSFKCSLAVKAKPGDDHYTLSIMIDDDSHYNNPNLIEQYYQRQAVLESFGWKCTHVLSKDWLQQPEKVLQGIIRRLHEQRTADRGQRTGESGQWTVDGGRKTAETQGDILPVIAEPVKPVTTNPSTPYDHLSFKRLTCTEDGSNKFWEAAIDINKMIVRFGKIGTKGQTQVKTFKDYEQANKEMEKLVREKVGKGYVG